MIVINKNFKHFLIKWVNYQFPIWIASKLKYIKNNYWNPIMNDLATNIDILWGKNLLNAF
jgi:hypothetical protein